MSTRAGQHQVVLGKAWTRRGKPASGYLTKQGAQRELDAILADARRHRITTQPRLASMVTFAEAAREGRHRKPPKHPTGFEWRAKLRQQDRQDAAIFLEKLSAALREASTGPPVPSVRPAA